jgi:hypothetical protein
MENTTTTNSVQSADGALTLTIEGSTLTITFTDGRPAVSQTFASEQEATLIFVEFCLR